MKTKHAAPFLFAVLTLSVFFMGFVSTENKKTGAEKGFALIELFTSEGCSSCPSADALVAKVLAENKDKPVYVLGYHVDYWNRLGWKDIYSKPEFSKRQRQYASLLHAQVYTPQIVVNGETAFVGSNNSALKKAIGTNLLESTGENVMLTGKLSTQNGLAVNYQVKGTTENEVLYLALVKKTAVSEVKSGENSGRELKHVNIVESLQAVPLKNSKGSVNIRLNNNTMANAEVIGFIQDTGSGHVKAVSKCVFAAM